MRNALDGTLFGAPLHPALTDVPIGASTTAVLLDALTTDDDAALGRAADAALAIAVLSALPAATTGLRDWSFVRGEAKRIGTAHALLNSTALL